MDTPEYKDQYTKLRQKLDNYEIELPSNDWDVFSKKLADAQTRHRRFAWYYIPVAASIIGALFLGTSYLLTQHPSENNTVTLAANTEKESKPASQAHALPATATTTPLQSKTQAINSKTAEHQFTRSESSCLQKTTSAGTQTGSSYEKKQNTAPETTLKDKASSIPEAIARNEQATLPTTIINFDTTGYITHPVKAYAELVETKQEKEEGSSNQEKEKKNSGSNNLVKWLAGTFQGNLGVSSTNSNDMLSDGSIGTQLLTRVSKADALQSSSTPTTMSFTGNKTHHAPLSFGVSIGIPLSNRWELQTGIAYTLLVTTGEIGSSSNTKATGRIEQHYLGIPLSLSYAFIKRNSFSVYMIGGGKIDKGISLVEKTYTYNAQDKLINQTHYQYSISGLQFSLDAGIGATYRIYRFINWYLETGGAWYIPSNQPESSHTEHPFNIALKTGVRFTISK